MRFLVSIFIGFVCIYFSPGTVFAEAFFNVQPDASITIDHLKFSSMEDFVGSEWFRANGRRCGTKSLKEYTGTTLKFRSAADCTAAVTRISQEYYPDRTVLVIPLYFHVIYNTQGTGNISDQKIYDQMTVLNEDFRSMAGSMGSNGFDTMIQFELKTVSRTENDTWFNDTNEIDYKQALGVDPATCLNVYTNTAGGYLGYAYLPQTDAGDVLDGVVMNYDTIGGRNNGFGIYDQGRTLVHEIGHYLGLEHTFADIGGACGATYDSGDLLVDTPPESEPHYECVATETCSCPDPIYNYMNYTPDTCMNEFTAEQGNRMVCSLMNYRPDAYTSVKLSIYLPGIVLPLLLDE